MRRVKERLLFDDYMRMIKSGKCASQRLLFSEELIFSADDYALLQERDVEFAALGFDMEFRGEGRVSIEGIPSNASSEQVDVLLYELLREVQYRDVGERMREKMALVMATKSSRKVAVHSREQAMDMLDRLCECENYSFSPSGKAIMAELTCEDLRLKLN